MLGILRSGPEKCKLIMGHQEFVGNLNMAYELGQGLERALNGGRGVIAISGRHKWRLEFDGVALFLGVHSGTAPTLWHTICSPGDLPAWCAHYLHLVNLDTWDTLDGSVIPERKGHLIPMKMVARTQLRGPYTAAWMLLRYLGAAPLGAKVPEPPFEGILERCDRNGLKMSRLHAVD